jgi:hypothetical protein
MDEIKWKPPHISLTIHHPYSYGDSAGITPDFPFNPDKSGTKSRQMYGKKNLTPKEFSTNLHRPLSCLSASVISILSRKGKNDNSSLRNIFQ